MSKITNTSTFSFNSVKGNTGVKGDTGSKGDIGIGLQGDKGDSGSKGDIGSQGNTGEVGSKGDKGEIGATGVTGATGGIGTKGDKGEVGATGSAGAAGSLRFGRFYASSQWSQTVSTSVNTKLTGFTSVASTNASSLFTVANNADNITFIGTNGTWVKITARVNGETSATGNQLWQVRLGRNGTPLTDNQSRAFFYSTTVISQRNIVFTAMMQLNNGDIITTWIINDTNSQPLFIYGYVLLLEA